MRLTIHFELSGQHQLVPLNYQYPVSAWIYHVLRQGDSHLAAMLHDEGYRLENGKTFKLFTFSRLSFPRGSWRISKGSDRMEVWARKGSIDVSFQIPQPAKKFIMGLFQEQEVYIGDHISGINMKVNSIEMNETIPIHTGPVRLRSISPIVLGITEKDQAHEQYVPPIHEQYKEVFIHNLIDKCQAAGITDLQPEDITLNLTQLNPKSALQTIKAHTPQETKVRGYFYEFEIEGPKEAIEVGLNAGFGSMNALGFGMCEVVKN